MFFGLLERWLHLRVQAAIDIVEQQSVTVISEACIFVCNAFLVTLVSGTVYKSKSIVAD